MPPGARSSRRSRSRRRRAARSPSSGTTRRRAALVAGRARPRPARRRSTASSSAPRDPRRLALLPRAGRCTSARGTTTRSSLSAVAGMVFFAASNNLITLFLGLEWFSISLYILCAITVDAAAALEAALKYLIIGSLGSGILLFGSAFVFGATGEIGFSAIAAGAPAGERASSRGRARDAPRRPRLQGVRRAVPPCGRPTSTRARPTPVTGFMAAATKVAALVADAALPDDGAFPSRPSSGRSALAVLACISLAWGNIAALSSGTSSGSSPTRASRNAGFLLMPIAAGNELGGQALLYYLIPYAALSIGAFAVVARPRAGAGPAGDVRQPRRLRLGAAVPRRRDGDLHVRLHRPAAARPLPRQVLRLRGRSIDRGWIWLVIVGAVFTAVSIYYYLGIVRAMYMTAATAALAPAGGSPPRDIALDADDRRLASPSRSEASSQRTRCSTSSATRSTPCPSRSRWPGMRVVVLGGGSTGEAFVARCAASTRTCRSRWSSASSSAASAPTSPACRRRRCCARRSSSPRRGSRPAPRRRSTGELDAERVFWWRDQVADGWDDTGHGEWLADRDIELVRGDGARARAGPARRSASGSSVRRARDRDRLAAGDPADPGPRGMRLLDEPRGDERRHEVPGEPDRPRRRAGRLRARPVLPRARRAGDARRQRATHLLPRDDREAGELLQRRASRTRGSTCTSAPRRARSSAAFRVQPRRRRDDRGRAAARRHRAQAERRGSRPRAARRRDLKTRASRSTSGSRAADDVWAIGDVDRHRDVHARRQVPGARRRGQRRRAATRAPTTAPIPAVDVHRPAGRIGRDDERRRARHVDAGELGGTARRPTSGRSGPGFLKVFADPERRVLVGAVAVGPGGGRVARPADARHPGRGADRRAARHDPALPDVLRGGLLRRARPAALTEFGVDHDRRTAERDERADLRSRRAPVPSGAWRGREHRPTR